MAVSLQLCRALIETHPEDAARLLERLSPQDVAATLEQLRPEEASRALECMELSHASACLGRWTDAELPRIVAALPVEMLAGVSGREGTGIGQRLLSLAPPDIAASARRLVLHTEHSAGAMMDPRVAALPHDINAGEARLRLRQQVDRISYYIYAVDRKQRLVGVVDLRQLMRAAARQPLASLMAGRVESLSVHAGLETILRHPGWRAFHALPVVDGKGVLRGVLRHATLRQLEDQGAADRGPGPFVVGLALMELCWSAATGMLQGIAGMARRATTNAMQEVRDGS